MSFVALEKLMFLDDGYAQSFVVEGVPLLLIQANGQRHLIRNQCPHRQADLRHGDIQNGSIRCNQHGWRFDLVTGECLLPGKGAGCLVRYPLVMEGIFIGVTLPLTALAD